MPYTKDKSVYYRIFYATTENGYHDDIQNFFLATRPGFNYKQVQTLTGDKNPQWRKQILAHTNATTGMSAASETHLSKPAGGKRYVKTVVGLHSDSQRLQFSGDVAGFRYMPPTDTHTAWTPVLAASFAQTQAMTKAFSQVRKAQQKMSGLVFLGEMREAMHMLRHPAEGLRKALQVNYLDKLKKLKKKEPDKWKKAISQTWLEGCFGWRPFLNDLEDAFDAYEEARLNLGPRYEKIRAIGKDRKFVLETRRDSFASHGDFYLLGNMRQWDEAVCAIRGEVKALARTTAMDKARVFGLTPSEFMPTAWELLPWSFLVDYFTNIGDIIEAGATDTSQVAWLEMSTIQTRTTEAGVDVDFEKNKALKGSSLKELTGSPGYCKFKRKIVSRGILTALTVPPLTFELPGSSIKQLNMLALFTQANSLNPQDARKLRGRIIR